MPPPRARARRAYRWSSVALVVVALASAHLVIPPSNARAAGGEWIPPVPGKVVAPFSEPLSRFGAGHRGVDFAAPPGSGVSASNDGTVTFAGDVAGSLHVVIAHGNGIRTSYSFLLRIDVQVGQRVRRGQVVGAAGGSGDRHGPGVLHFGVRIGDRYVDPMLLFRPPDLTEMVHLVPAGERRAADRSTPSDEAQGLRDGLPARADGPDDHPCSGVVGDVADVIGLGDVAETVCEHLPSFVRRAVHRGLDLVQRAGRAASRAWQHLRNKLHSIVSLVEDAVDGIADAYDRLVAEMAQAEGAAFRAILQLGGEVLEHLTACPQPPPDANPARTDNLVMAVAGLGSSRRRRPNGQPGASFEFDWKALGYLESNVEYFNYDPHRDTYRPAKTTEDLHRKARLLGRQIKALAAAHPGQRLDLVAHSQGGVVVALFLQEVYRGHEDEYPVIDNVVTFASPLQGTPTANLAREADRHALFQLPLGLARGAFPVGARSLEQLCEGSRTIQRLWRHGVPRGVRFLSIGGNEDLVVPSPSTEVGHGGTSIVVEAGDPFVPDDHSAILRDDDAVSAAQTFVHGGEPAACGLLSGGPGIVYAEAVRAATAALEATDPTPDRHPISREVAGT